MDVGSGQGTQAIALAQRGVRVTGVEPSTSMMGHAQAAAAQAGAELRLLQGDLSTLRDIIPEETFDLVCCHGVLMYVPDAEAALGELTARVRPGGTLAFTVRNGDALAYRPGIRGDFAAAVAAFDSTTYRNELGADAHAHRLDDVLSWCARLGLTVEAWYGVRVFTDGISTEHAVDPATIDACLAAEREAGRRDPYRRLASQLHVIATRAPATSES